MEEDKGLNPTLRLQKDKAEKSLVELKARVQNLDTLRKRLARLRAERIGSFRQRDTYFEVPKGRLKLRQTDGSKKAQLIYYERDDVARPKESRVFIINLRDAERFKTALEKILVVKATVDKTREIYRFKGTQVHLDQVEGLGTFIEFERKTPEDPNSVRKNRKVLEGLMKTLGIELKSLEGLSYSDLV